MANVAYPPFFPAQILDGDGQPVANGSIRAAFAGSDVPAPLFTPDGTALGSSVTLNSSGEAVFCLRAGTAYKLTCLDAQGATVWVRDNVRVTTADSGMANPMEAAGDLIVGAPDGQPDRLAAGTTGQVLKIGADGNPCWSTDEKGMANPMTTAGDIIVGGASGTPARLGVGTSGKILTSNGTTATWEAPAEQEGDHKIKVDALDSEAGYLVQKLYGGTMVNVSTAYDGDGYEHLQVDLATAGSLAGDVLTADGNGGATFSAPAPQPGDHQLLVSATDAAAGYLSAKLTAGSNVTLTTQTDGDGVQTLEISATGGGGGGGAPAIIEPFKIANCTGTTNDAGCAVMQFAPYKFTPTALTYYVNAYTGSTRKIKGVVYNSSGKVVYSSAELPLVNKMNTIPLSKVTTYEDKAYFTPGELFFIGVAISSGDSSYQWWTMSSTWYKSFVMSYPPPDTKSSTNQNTIHWMSLTVTPLS